MSRENTIIIPTRTTTRRNGELGHQASQCPIITTTLTCKTKVDHRHYRPAGTSPNDNKNKHLLVCTGAGDNDFARIKGYARMYLYLCRLVSFSACESNRRSLSLKKPSKENRGCGATKCHVKRDRQECFFTRQKKV